MLVEIILAGAICCYFLYSLGNGSSKTGPIQKPGVGTKTRPSQGSGAGSITA